MIIVLYCLHDNLMCLFFASFRCAHVKSELWTWTLRSLCPYQPRLYFSNYKVTVVIYLGKLLTFSHKIIPILYTFVHILMSHAIPYVLSICHRNKRNFKLQNNLPPLTRSETGNFLYIYYTTTKYFFFLI